MFSLPANVLAFLSFVHIAKTQSLKSHLVKNFEINAALTAWAGQPLQNMVTAPILMRMSLCKLATAAHGPAKHELMNVLDYTREKNGNCESDLRSMLRILKLSNFLILNKMFVNYSSDIEPKFVNNSQRDFGVHVDKVPFNKPGPVIKYINDWFDRNSYRRFPNLVSNREVNNMSSILLVSAAHIQSSWEVAFNILLTSSMKFKGLDKKVHDVAMMTAITSALYYNDDTHNFKIIQVNLGSVGLSMMFMLPERYDGLVSLARYMSPHFLDQTKAKMKFAFVNFSIPRFKIKTTWDLDGLFKKIGVKELFKPEASGLDSILRSRRDCKRIYLSKAKQSVLFEVDEYGVFRNAVRAREYSEKRNQLGIRPAVEEEFLADHPFLFMVNLQHSPMAKHQEIAMGVYYGPDK